MKSKLHFKIVAAGDKNSGATDLLYSYTNHIRLENEGYVPTIFDNASVDVTIEGFEPISLHLFDASYDVKLFQNLVGQYYPQTDLFLLCFSLIRPGTLESIEKIISKEVNKYCRGAPCILVGVETYLRDELEKNNDFVWRKEKLSSQGCKPISTSEGERVAKKIHALKYIECSPIKGTNVEEVFDISSRYLIEHINDNDKDDSATKSECKVF